METENIQEIGPLVPYIVFIIVIVIPFFFIFMVFSILVAFGKKKLAWKVPLIILILYFTFLLLKIFI